MEPIKGGGLAKLPSDIESIFKASNPQASVASWALRFAASLDAVSVVLSGMSAFSQMQDNISIMKDFKPLSTEEQEIIKQVAAAINKIAAIPCTGCRYCLEGESNCPKHIPIPAVFSLYNSVKQYGFHWHNYAYYEDLCRDFSSAAECIKCRQCEKKCPQHIEISQWLPEVHKTLSDISLVID
jgi:predicted aldo/keto reductase-like oxidoreductase